MTEQSIVNPDEKSNSIEKIPSWFPRIGEPVSPAMGIKIADYFGLMVIAERVETNPERYKSFTFDGCSCLPDQLLGLFAGCDWQDITYLCCLPHDISYAYGEPGNSKEKKVADYLFRDNLINKAKMKKFFATVCLAAVELGGGEEFKLSNVSWSFATKRGKEDW